MDNQVSLESLIAYLRSLSDAQMEESFTVYLKEGLLGQKPVYTTFERHRFLTELFNHCDPSLQEKIRRVFSYLLQNFEGTNPGDNPAYLYSLISVATVVRSSYAKERLLRWVRLGTFAGWKHELFDLTSELIIAASSYDADDEWIDFMLNVFPQRATFGDSALATYRAIWQTRGEDCLALLPEILAAGKPADPGFSKSLGYLLRLTIRKIGHERFRKLTIDAFQKSKQAVPTVWLAILKFDEMLDSELARHKADLINITEEFGKLWEEGVAAWRDLPDHRAHEAFAKLMDIPGRESTTFRPAGVRAAFKFGKGFFLHIYESDTYILENCGDFFEDIEEIGMPTVA